MLLGGLTLLLLSVCGAVSLVSDVLFGPGVAAITTAGVAAFYVLFWYVLPIVTRIRASLASGLLRVLPALVDAATRCTSRRGLIGARSG